MPAIREIDPSGKKTAPVSKAEPAREETSAAEFSELLNEVAGTFFGAAGGSPRYDVPNLELAKPKEPKREDKASERPDTPAEDPENSENQQSAVNSEQGAKPAEKETEVMLQGEKPEAKEDTQGEEPEAVPQEVPGEAPTEATPVEVAPTDVPDPHLVSKAASELVATEKAPIEVESAPQEDAMNEGVSDELSGASTQPMPGRPAPELSERVKAELAKADKPEQQAKHEIQVKPAEQAVKDLQTQAASAAKAQLLEPNEEPIATPQSNFPPGLSAFSQPPGNSPQPGAFPGLGVRAVAIPEVKPDRDQIVSQLALKQAIEGAGKAGNEKGTGIGTPQAFTTPLFGKLDGQGKSEAAQMKLAKAAMRAVPEQALEKVESALREAAKAKDGTTISLRLDPPSLGSVKVDVSLRDGTLHARIIPESPQVGQFLRDKAAELAASLKKLGLDVEKISVSVSADSGGSFLGMNSGETFSGRKEDSSGGGYGYGGERQVPVMTEAVSPVQELDHWVA